MKTKLLYSLAVSAFMLASNSAVATTVNSAASSAYDYSFNMTTDVGGASLPSKVTSAGSAPATYSDLDTFSNYALQYGGSVQKVVFSAQTLSTAAASNVDGGNGSRTTSATSDLTGFSYYSFFTGGYKVELSIGAIGSTSTVTGMPGSFAAASTLTLTNLLLKVNDVSMLNLSGPIAANTVYNYNILLPGSGITLYLNEQSGSCGAAGCSIATNALHMNFVKSPVFGAALGGPVSGDIILAHTQANMVGAVPEPETWAMLLAGLGLVGFAARRRESTGKQSTVQ